jgi:HEAT repeat protein
VDAALALTELGDEQGIQEFASHLSGLDYRNKDSLDAAQALEAAGEKAIGMLAAILEDPDKTLMSHRGAASVLAMIGGERSQDALMNIFEQRLVNNDSDFRMDEAAKALERIGSERLVDRLLTHVNGRRDSWEEHSRKIKAIFILGAIGSSCAVESLINELFEVDGNYNPWSKERTHKVSRAAAIALGQIGDARAVAPLIDKLGANSCLSRDTPSNCAADALVRIGESAVGPLVQALSNANPKIRLGAAYALVYLRSSDAVPALIKILEGPDGQATGQRPEGDWIVAMVACDALREIGDRSAVPALKAVTASKSTLLRESAEKALEALTS